MQTCLIPRSDLERVHEALRNAHKQNEVLDLLDAYRKLNRQNRGSAMTLALGSALEIVEDVLEQQGGDDAVPEV